MLLWSSPRNFVEDFHSLDEDEFEDLISLVAYKMPRESFNVIVALRAFRKGRTEIEVMEMTMLKKEAYKKFRQRLCEPLVECARIYLKPEINKYEKPWNTDVKDMFYGSRYKNNIIKFNLCLKAIQKEKKFIHPEYQLIQFYELKKITKEHSIKYTEYFKHIIEIKKGIDSFIKGQHDFSKILEQLLLYFASGDDAYMAYFMNYYRLLYHRFGESENYHIKILLEIVHSILYIFTEKKVHRDADASLKRIDNYLSRLNATPEAINLRHFYNILICERYLRSVRRKPGTTMLQAFEHSAPRLLNTFDGRIAIYTLLTRVSYHAKRGDNTSDIDFIHNYNLLDKKPKPDVPEYYIPYMLYLSLAYFYIKEYDQASLFLDEMVKNVNLKQYRHSEIEATLFQIVVLINRGSISEATDLFNKFRRKCKREKWNNYYPQLVNLMKFFKHLLLTKTSNDQKKLSGYFNGFSRNNKKRGRKVLLRWLVIDAPKLNELINAVLARQKEKTEKPVARKQVPTSLSDRL